MPKKSDYTVSKRKVFMNISFCRNISISMCAPQNKCSKFVAPLQVRPHLCKLLYHH